MSIPELHREKNILINAIQDTLKRLQGVYGTYDARVTLQVALDSVSPSSLRVELPTREIGEFNELDIKEVAKLIQVEYGTLQSWLKGGYPMKWKEHPEPFPETCRINGQLRLWSGPAVARWYNRNRGILNTYYKRYSGKNK